MRILGITIPEDKRIEMGLTALYGIGRSRAHKILTEANVDFGARPKDISADQENKIKTIIEDLRLEADLKRDIGAHIKRLKDIKSYRGSRHARKLPARGQRTKTNARTLKGVKKTMGSGRRKESKT
jgi:small subunit ribosomal protein S13